MHAENWTSPLAPLDAVEAAFIQLAHHAAYVIDGRQLGGAVGVLRLDELREELRETDYAARDAVLGWLVGHARQDPGWRLAIAGVLLPGLRRAAGELTRRFPGDSWDLEAELLTGFLEAVARDDGQPPKVASRLVWAAFRHTWRVRYRDAVERRRLVFSTSFDAVAAPRQPIHPDQLLGVAVQVGVLRAWEAELIAASRSEHGGLVRLQAVWTLPYEALRKRRRRAELRLGAWLLATGQVDRSGSHAWAEPSAPPTDARKWTQPWASAGDGLPLRVLAPAEGSGRASQMGWE